METKKYLIEAMRRELAAAKLQHIQMLLSAKDGEMVVRFVSVDSDNLRARLKAITDRYCESLMPIKETKTTRVFAI